MKTVFFKSNQGAQERDGVKPDYIIYNFPELTNAIRFFEKRLPGFLRTIRIPAQIREYKNGPPGASRVRICKTIRAGYIPVH
jgi:hypothetical protein